MQKFFLKVEFEDYADDNLILVRLDFPRSIEQSAETKAYNNQLAQRYGVQGFPTILLFNSQGKMVLQTGYQPGGPANYINHLKSYL
ncbi:MAG: thioredoxin family protein [Ignavibacteriales bacterium]|nr:thioredoxin family protein [Ignavibacteriales bacterium]